MYHQITSVVRASAIAFLMLLPLLTFSQTKRALIVAIADYPEETKWRKINSLSDVPLIQGALSKHGFEDFTVLENELANKKGILAAIHDLKERSEPNDILVLHFSSHGQKMADDNADELDGYDEAIVAYGGPAFFTKDYNDENHLRDDQIEELIEGLRKQVGPKGDVLMIADACHSGTISRGEISRGGMPPMEDPANPPMARGVEDVGLFQKTAVSRGSDGDMSPFVLISAAQASQVNYEYQGAGSLSTAISRCADNMTEGMSYRSFFAQLLKEMSVIAPNQLPAIEGDIDRELFAGKAINQMPYYIPYKIIDGIINIRGGMLTGLFKNTEVAIYDAGTTDPTDSTIVPLATGKIINAKGTWSKAQLDKTLSGTPENYWVFVTKQTFGDLHVKVQLNSGDSPTDKILESEFQSFALVSLVTENPEYVIVNGDGDMVDIIRYSDNEMVATELSIYDEASEVKTAIQNFAKGKYIKNWDLKYPGIDVSFEFIPILLGEEDEEGFREVLDTLTLEEISENGVMIFRENIGAHIRVTNNGTKPAYFAIVDIQPNGIINGIIPDPNPESGHQKEQFKIAPGKSYIISDHKVVFFDPYGTEVYKLFASKKALDFTPILTGNRTRNEMTDLEMLFDDGIQAATRGSQSEGVRNDMAASTFSISFQIQPEK